MQVPEITTTLEVTEGTESRNILGRTKGSENKMKAEKANIDILLVTKKQLISRLEIIDSSKEFPAMGEQSVTPVEG